MRKSYGCSDRVVLEKTYNGNIVEYEDQKRRRGHLVQDSRRAIICGRTYINMSRQAKRREFGYQADTPAARRVLDGTYNYTEYFDPPNKELLDECARVRTIITDRSVNINLKRGGWQHIWGKAKEKNRRLCLACTSATTRRAHSLI